MNAQSIMDPWRRELTRNHWLFAGHPAARGGGITTNAFLTAPAIGLSPDFSRSLLMCMERGLSKAAQRQREPSGHFDDPRADSAECSCFFPHPHYAWDARLPFETMWIETADIKNCRWGILSNHITSDGRDLAGTYFVFLQTPAFQKVKTFYGRWATLGAFAGWRNGILVEAAFDEAMRNGLPAFITAAHEVQSKQDLERLPSGDPGTASLCDFDGDDESVFAQSLGGQFTTMLVTAVSMINSGHATGDRGAAPEDLGRRYQTSLHTLQ